RDFSGDLNETAMLYMPDNVEIRRLLIVGMGKKKEFNQEKAYQVFGTAAKFSRDKKLKHFTLCLTGIESAGFDKRYLAQAAAEGALLSLYKFMEYKTEDTDKKSTVKQITLFDTRRLFLEDIREGAILGRLLAEGTCYARDLASHPGNVVTPEYLASEAKEIAAHDDLKCTILDEKALREKNMNGILSVAKGSHLEPRLVILEYDCGHAKAETVAVVGKGLTFDSGGISIKPAKKMEEMKYDMCGAAAVFGLMKIIRQLKPQVNVVGIVAAAENMPGGGATKPGDIINTYAGLSVEIINTDAEGRLVLCDALAYAVDTYKPHAVIDLATLTGAVVVALGHYATGMLGNNSALLKKVIAAGEHAGEMVWELPLYPEFDEHIKSDCADIKNSNGPGAGTIFGAVFLQRFVREAHWVHLDIAGTAYDVKEKSYMPKGPTGVGVRLLARLLADWS
ncbi:leucyl aminopeptidase, partial [candidate division KSB1 bacterium]